MCSLIASGTNVRLQSAAGEAGSTTRIVRLPNSLSISPGMKADSVITLSPIMSFPHFARASLNSEGTTGGHLAANSAPRQTDLELPFVQWNIVLYFGVI